MHDDLKQEQNRLTNRMRDQLWRYYPQMGAFSEDFASDFILDLWHAVPTPDAAARATTKAIGRILKSPLRCRDRARHSAPAAACSGARNHRRRHRPYPHRRGAAAARQYSDHRDRAPARRTVRRHRMSRRDRAGANLRAARLDDRDLAILRSYPGLGRINVATLLAKGRRASAAARLPRLADAVGRCSGHQAQRQELHRDRAPCLQHAPADRALSLGAGRHPARSDEPPALCGAAGARR